jgi:hypothetical protein
MSICGGKSSFLLNLGYPHLEVSVETVEGGEIFTPM